MEKGKKAEKELQRRKGELPTVLKIRQDDVKCPICCRVFKTNKQLNDHMPVHTGKKDFECEDCGKFYSNKNSLACHKSSKHAPPSALKFQCDECTEKFRSQSLLTQHKKQSHKKKGVPAAGEGAGVDVGGSHICPLCGQSFRRMSYLNLHVRSHGEEKTFKCRECDRSFSAKWEQQEHHRLYHHEASKGLPEGFKKGKH